VRKLVGSLARRTELWRQAASGETEWEAATRSSLYKGEVSADALAHSARALERLWQRLGRTELAALAQGELQ
jgi:hypothetical protein